MKKNYQPIVGAIVFILGLVIATGIAANWWQGVIAIPMLIAGGAWMQGIKVREFVRRIFSEEPSRYDSIKHKSGIKYNQAAIFVGTACLFIGSPDECDEVVDDLWHRGVQAEVTQLTGDEHFNVL